MLRRAIVATALALLLAAAEGCGSSSNSGPPDASSNGDGSVDAGADAPAEAEEAGPDCGAMPPTGKQIVPSTDPLVVFTLTDDDHAVYENLSTQELYAVATSGGTPSDIGKMTSQGGTIWTRGNVVLYLPVEANPQTSIAPLSAWTASGGTSVISSSALALDSYFYTYDASKDGQYVAYFQTINDAPATLMVSTVDGKTQTPLVTNIDLTDQSCFPPSLEFVNDTLVVEYCQIPGPDAGTTAETATIAAFAGPSFTPAVTLGTTFQPFQGAVTVNPTGTQALLADPGTGLSLYPLSGGAPVPIDAKGASALFASNGDVIYTTTSTALVRYATATGVKTTLVPSGLNIPLDLSPDGNWLQVAALENSTTEQYDLQIVSATTPGTANDVVKTATTEPFGFTVDSNYSVFGTNFPQDFGAQPYSLEASKTSGGAATKLLAAAAGPIYTSGSKLVCNTNQTKSTGAADIVALDLSTSAAPTTLVTQADPNLFLTSTKSLVYSWYCDETSAAGLWTLTPP